MMMIILLSLVYLMTNGHFILGTFNPILEYYKILTYGVFILCGCWPITPPLSLSIE